MSKFFLFLLPFLLFSEEPAFFHKTKESPTFYDQLNNKDTLKLIIGEPWDILTNTTYYSRTNVGLRSAVAIFNDTNNMDRKITLAIYSLSPEVRSISEDLDSLLLGQQVPLLDKLKYDQEIRKYQDFDFTLYKSQVECFLENRPEKYIAIRFGYKCADQAMTDKIISQLNLARAFKKLAS